MTKSFKTKSRGRKLVIRVRRKRDVKYLKRWLRVLRGPE